MAGFIAMIGGTVARGIAACPEFRAGAIYPTGNESLAVAMHDFNRDGHRDLAVAGSKGVSIFLGTGTGAFGAPAVYPAHQRPNSIAVGDLNRDGKDDIVVSNSESHDFSVLLGNGDGTLSAPSNIELNSVYKFPYLVLLIDLDRDGNLDLAGGYWFRGVRFTCLMRGRGDGTFSLPQDLDAPQVAFGDFDRDGKFDLAALTYIAFPINNPPSPPSVNYVPAVEIRPGKGDGTFGFAKTYSLGGRGVMWALIAADINGDGADDVAVVTSTDPSGGRIAILSGNGDGTFGIASNYAVGSGPQSIAAGDINGDGIVDLAVGNHGSKSVSLLLGSRSTFANPVDFLAGGQPNGLAVGDLNHDGRSDVVLAGVPGNPQVPDLCILLAKSDGVLAGAQVYPTAASPYAIASGDFNGDRKRDLAVTNSNNAVTILLGTGTGAFAAPKIYPAATDAPTSIAVTDLNGDLIEDLIIASYMSSSVSILLGNGDGSFGPPSQFQAGGPPSFLALGDFDNDSKTDIVVANDIAFVGTSRVSILLGNGDGTFSAPLSHSVDDGPRLLLVADFDRNGRQDIAVLCYASGNGVLSLLSGNGNGTFVTKSKAAPMGFSVSSIAAADFDDDGKLDIAVSRFPEPVWILRGKGDGIFEEPVPYGFQLGSFVGPPTFVVGDFNGDGVTDLAVTTYPVVLLRTTHDRTVRPYAVASRWPAADDFNGDGRSDLVLQADDGIAVLLGSCSPSPTWSLTNPDTGPTTGGQMVVIEGTNLAEVAAVTFGGLLAHIVGKSDTRITVTTPAHVEGAVEVVAATADGTMIPSGRYTYVASSGAVPVPALSLPLFFLMAALLAISGTLVLRKQ